MPARGGCAMSGPSGGNKPANKSRRFPIEIIGKKSDPRIGENVGRRPTDDAGSNGPYLIEVLSDFGGETPPPNDTPRDRRTHDMNEEMLAEADRRGLRIGLSGHRSRCSLKFLFGSK